jgi:hypothetical protein
MRSAWHAEHDADQRERAAGDVEVHERLGPARVEVPAVVAKAPVLGVEEAGRRVAGPTFRPLQVVAGGRGSAWVGPAPGDSAGAVEQPLGRGTLLRRGKCERRILLQGGDRATECPRRQR